MELTIRDKKNPQKMTFFHLPVIDYHFFILILLIEKKSVEDTYVHFMFFSYEFRLADDFAMSSD